MRVRFKATAAAAASQNCIQHWQVSKQMGHRLDSASLSPLGRVDKRDFLKGTEPYKRAVADDLKFTTKHAG